MTQKRIKCCHRAGKTLVFVVVALPAIVAIVGLVLDGGLMTTDNHNLQHGADAASTAAAMELLLGKSPSAAVTAATLYLREHNHMAEAGLAVHIPPVQGSYAGRDGYVEVVADHPYRTRLIHFGGANRQQTLSARAVAGYGPSTAGAAIVVLDPEPPAVSINGIPVVLALPSLPAVIGGLEVLGSGTARVDGAVLVNTKWGGVDEDGNPAGNGPGPPYGISCTPLLSTTRLEARDIRVAGGVDNPNNYGNFDSGQSSPLRANRMAVPDPLVSVPAPTTASDPTNVNPQLRGGVRVVAPPLIAPPTVLQPGVYEWIEVVSGAVVFEPGVYIIRGVNPATGIALNILGGTVVADGVMFYLTDSTGYDAVLIAPDESDGDTAPAAPVAQGLVPSAVINAALAGSRFSPLTAPGSPFDGLWIYQRRHDRRPIVVANQNLLLGGSVSGTVYAKWGHVLLAGAGSFDLRIVAGSARLLALSGVTLAPSNLLPPARDVFLVE